MTPWGIRIIPFAACFADSVPKMFHHPDLYTGGLYFITPERGREEATGGEH